MAKNVLIAVNTAGAAGMGKLAGIFRYLRTHADWNMTIVRHPTAFTCDVVRQAVKDGCDGYLLSVGESEEAMRLVRAQTAPVVLADIRDEVQWRGRERVAFVRNSSRAIGHAAADYLMGTGRCRSFAFVHFNLGRRKYDWNDERLAAYRERLAEHGTQCAECHAPDGLERLERPVGVFAANDEVAYNVIRHCRERRLRVPDSVLVVGVDNDVLICENARPRITSIQPDFDEEGYLAAQALDRLMRTPDAASSSIDAAGATMVGVAGVVERESSVRVSHSGKMIQKACVYIRENALRGITVEDVVRHLGWSRRLTDLRFRELQGETVGQMIIRQKLDAVRRLLTTTDKTIEAITRECGYENATHLKDLFKRHCGMTMRDYRRRNASGGRA